MRKEAKLPALDGLRGLAILLVLFNHFGWILAPYGGYPPFLFPIARMGYSGVELFFALSGFLLFLPYAKALLLNGTPWPDVRLFYFRRVCRILPVYAAYLAVLAVLLVVSHAATREAARSLFIMGLLAHNMDEKAFLFMEANNTALWTLPVEWQFYLILPLLALLLAAIGRRHLGRLIAGLVVVIVASLAVNAWIAWLHYGLGYVRSLEVPGITGLIARVLFGMQGRYLDAFAVGIIAALVYTRLGSLPRPRASLVLAALAVACLLACTIWDYHARTDLGAPWPDATPQGILWPVLGNWALTASFACLLLAVLWASPRNILSRVFRWRPLCFLGTISYSLYIWHVTVLRYTPAGLALVVPLILLAVGTVSYYVIERPFLRLRRLERLPLFGKRQLGGAAASAPVAVAAQVAEPVAANQR